MQVIILIPDKNAPKSRASRPGDVRGMCRVKVSVVVVAFPADYKERLFQMHLMTRNHGANTKDESLIACSICRTPTVLLHRCQLDRSFVLPRTDEYELLMRMKGEQGVHEAGMTCCSHPDSSADLK